MKRTSANQARAIVLAIVSAWLTDGCVLDRAGGIEQTCSSVVDCDDGTPCTEDVCNAQGLCEHNAVDATPSLTQVPFDCKRMVCENGRAVARNDDADVPTNNPCVTAACTDGALSETPKAEGAQCQLGEGTGTCQMGECVVNCNKQNPDDPVCDDHQLCTTDFCDAVLGTCIHDGLDNVVVKDAFPEYRDDPQGDCRVDLCLNGFLQVDQVDDQDIEIDSCPCTVDSCSAGTPVHEPLPASTPCPEGGGNAVCDGACTCVGCVAVTDCPIPGNQCMDRDCQAQNCVEVPKGGGTACNDVNACSQTDQCDGNGNCVGSNFVVCTALDQCHLAGVCNPSNGVCSNPNKPNGSGCTDNNACTQTDTCQGGACQGGNPVVCTAMSQCHNPGTCNPSTGVCSNPTKANGTGCNDGNACTQTDTCQSGNCTGSNPVVCTAMSQCHNVGTCNPSTGVCSNPAKSNGSACDDGLYCNGADTCQGGNCSGHAGNPCTPDTNDPDCNESCNEAANNCTGYDGDGFTCQEGGGTDTCESGGACTQGTPCPSANYDCL